MPGAKPRVIRSGNGNSQPFHLETPVQVFSPTGETVAWTMPLTSSRFQKPDHYKTQKRIWDWVNSERSTGCPRKWGGVSKPGLSLGGKTIYRERTKQNKREHQDKTQQLWAAQSGAWHGVSWVLGTECPPPPFWWEGDGASLGAQGLIFLHPWFRQVLMYPSSSEWKVLKLSLEDRFTCDCFGGGQTTWYLEQGEKQSPLFS